MQGRFAILSFLVAALHVSAGLAPLGHGRLLEPRPSACSKRRDGRTSKRERRPPPLARSDARCVDFHADAGCLLCMTLATGVLWAIPPARQSFHAVLGATGFLAGARDIDQPTLVTYGAHAARSS